MTTFNLLKKNERKMKKIKPIKTRNEKISFLKAVIVIMSMNKNELMTAEEIWYKIIEQDLCAKDDISIEKINEYLLANCKNSPIEIIDGKRSVYLPKEIFEFVDIEPYTYRLLDKNSEIVKPIVEVYKADIYEEWERNKDPKIFENIVSELMLNYFDSKFKAKIKGLLRKEKRMMILSLLDKERNLFKRAKALMPESGSVSKLEHIKELIGILREYVHVGETEKKRLGEVMTPLELVDEMLDTLPVEVWSNHKLKWLDSSNGTGPFLAMVVSRLMEGLVVVFPDQEERYRHIIKNMIYAGELQAKNMFLWITLMDPYDEYNMNVYTGSFLDEGFDNHMKTVWGIEKFDIVVGNPPYQKNIEGGSVDKPIWHFFVNKSLDYLKQNGYMCLVHPSGWRSIKTFEETKERLLSLSISHLKMHSFKEGQKIFNVAINFDFYCLKNCKTKIKTNIICENKENFVLYLSELKMIPSENILEISSLFAKEGEEKIELISNSAYHTSRFFISKEKSEEYKYPCVYTVRTNNEPTLKWSRINTKGHFEFPKVIFARGASGVIADINGEYALTEFAYGIVDSPENIKNIAKAISSQKFIKEIMLFKNSLGDRYNRKMITLFRKDFWKEFI